MPRSELTTAQALAFFASVIKSGEPWTETCQRTYDAALARLVDGAAPLWDALVKISAIRDSIIGRQTVNWSMHVYPLVAALHEAGFPGAGYEEARKRAVEEDAAFRAVLRALLVGAPTGGNDAAK